MKFKTTKKAIQKGYYRIIGIGYCNAQNLLSYETPVAYTCGSYGWNCDIYDIDGVAIMTGYRGMITDNMVENYELLREYEQKAENIKYDRKIEWQKQKELIHALLVEFLDKSKKEA